MAEPEILLKFQAVYKAYRDLWGRPKTQALDGFELAVARGEVVGMLGPNGAGKTTAIRLLTGLARPDRGKVEVLGGSPQEVARRRRLGYLPEDNQLLPFLTAEETLDFHGKLLGMDKRRRREASQALLDRVGLRHALGKRVGGFSKGMARRLGLAQALMGDPEFLVLDEPTSGLDPLGARDFKELLRERKAAGTTVLLCSHLLAEIETICDRVAIIHRGRNLREGSLTALLEDPETQVLRLRRPPEEILAKILDLIHQEKVEAEPPTARRKSLEELFVESLQHAGVSKEGDAFRRLDA